VSGAAQDTALARADRVLAPLGIRAVAIVGHERHGAYHVLRCADPSGPRPRAGQFYMLATVRRWGGVASQRPFLPRAFSVLRAPADTDELQFMLDEVGPGTERLCELQRGDQLSILGPLGIGFAPARDGRAPLLVGGGVGIAPLAIWQDQLNGAPALIGFRDAEHAPGAALLDHAQLATDDGSVGHHGLVTELLGARLRAEGDIEVYACGPPRMLEAVRELCAATGTPAQLALESGMACGYGACFGCVVPTTDGGYVRLCIDGPVIDAARLPSALIAGAGD
jgi:dihydroorotate dehydrogenase electron transfer subunit